MSYIDAWHDTEHDKVHVVERVNGQRKFNVYHTDYTFYVPDPSGKAVSVFGTPVSRVACRTKKELNKEKAIHAGKQLFESDINPVFRCLEQNYIGQDPADLHVAYFDIEVDFHETKGFAPTEDPFNKVTAITVYLSWLDKLVTLAIPPKRLTMETARDLVAGFDNTILFESEAEMLETFLSLIDDADVMSGWNSGAFDIPYLVNRITRVLSKEDNRRWCLWEQMPKRRTFERFGSETLTFDLVGRVHMDYYDLYRKFTFEERHSYSLDAIGEYELDERKTAYEGTLDQLYNQDFKTFIEYNRQDVMIVAKLDNKLKFMVLANTLANKNTVLLATTLGSVAMIEQAIVNEAHRRGVVVADRAKKSGENTGAAGAYVAVPVKGIHEYVGSVDINSLYPSTIRALNMGQETIVGQLRPDLTDAYLEPFRDKDGNIPANAWEGLFATLEYTAVMNRSGELINLDWADGGTERLAARDIWHLIFESDLPWGISANGTIFTFEKQAIVPGLLERWYAERKEFQAILKQKIEEGAPKLEQEHWDRQQHTTKIQLNSLYGTLLNEHCRFYDKRLGQSTTLTGRSITRHMASHINETIAGGYDHTGKAIIYGDTDSCYFSAWPLLSEAVASGDLTWDNDTAVDLYDSVADAVNASFPAFMEQAFHCPRDFGSLIKCGREIVARRGLYITKKRYAVMYYDKDGHRYDTDGKPGKLKAMGLDLKRADTPKFVQEFLAEILSDVLNGAEKDSVVDKIKTFKQQFRDMPSWQKGTPKRVNNMTKFTKMFEARAKGTIPGHVRAAIHWNLLKQMNNDKRAMSIVDGQKTIVCKLKDNPMGWTSVGYPIDEAHLPDWFKELPFDDDLMMQTIVDAKVDNVLGVLDWGLQDATDILTTFNNLFEF